MTVNGLVHGSLKYYDSETGLMKYISYVYSYFHEGIWNY